MNDKQQPTPEVPKYDPLVVEAFAKQAFEAGVHPDAAVEYFLRTQQPINK